MTDDQQKPEPKTPEEWVETMEGNDFDAIVGVLTAAIAQTRAESMAELEKVREERDQLNRLIEELGKALRRNHGP